MQFTQLCTVPSAILIICFMYIRIKSFYGLMANNYNKLIPFG